MPGVKQAWPNSAACWSPAMPASGTSRPPSIAMAVPAGMLDGTSRGSSARGMRSRSSMNSSQSPVARLKSSVRLAFDSSVRCCCWPPASFQASQLSIVPNASSPSSARRRSAGSEASSQASLVPEKYGSSSRPVRRATSGSSPSALRRAQASAVRRSCHTIAGATGRPFARSHSTVVSRWFVMPTAATSATVARARASTSAMVATCVAQISSASCSTQPECGKCCVNSRCAVATGLPP